MKTSVYLYGMEPKEGNLASLIPVFMFVNQFYMYYIIEKGSLYFSLHHVKLLHGIVEFVDTMYGVKTVSFILSTFRVSVRS